MAVAVSGGWFSLADDLDRKRRFRSGEPWRAARLGITNPIVRPMRHSGNLLIISSREVRLDAEKPPSLLKTLGEASRMVLTFLRLLKS